MDVFRIAGFAVITAVLALTVKNYKPELGIQVSVAGGLILLMIAVSEFSGIASQIRSLMSELEMGDAILLPAFKVIGIAYMTQTASDICSDSGETALASKAQLCGRLLMASCALPVIISLARTVTGLIGDHL